MRKQLDETQRRELLKLVEEQNDINLARWFINHDLNPHDYLQCLIKANEGFHEPYASVAIQLSVWRDERERNEHDPYENECKIK